MVSLLACSIRSAAFGSYLLDLEGLAGKTPDDVKLLNHDRNQTLQLSPDSVAPAEIPGPTWTAEDVTASSPRQLGAVSGQRASSRSESSVPQQGQHRETNVCMSLDCGRKPEDRRESSRHRENKQAGVGIGATLKKNIIVYQCLILWENNSEWIYSSRKVFIH